VRLRPMIVSMPECRVVYAIPSMNITAGSEGASYTVLL
jgi:hypothetical protein